jgi:hypothetical protein
VVNPISILFGFTSLTGYAVYGARWLRLKAEGRAMLLPKKFTLDYACIFVI